MNGESKSRATTFITGYARPKRIAFLVDPVDTSEHDLNQIIRFCVRSWGGRFNPIVPTDGANILSNWWQLLLLTDPDVVFSLVPLQKSLIRRIDRYILPSEIKQIKGGAGEQLRIYDVAALGIEDLPRFVLSHTPSFQRPNFVVFKEDFKDTAVQTFLLRNFGTLPDDLGTREAFRELPHTFRSAAEESPCSALASLLDFKSHPIVPIDLCGMQAPKNYDLDYGNFAFGFHLVVGDTFFDTIYAWNRSILSNGGESRDWFWLPSAYIDNEDLLGKLGGWIQQRFWADSHHRTGLVLSSNLSEQTLKDLSAKMSKLAGLPFRPVRLPSADFPKCEGRSTRRKMLPVAQHVPLSNGQGFLEIPRPAFLLQSHPQSEWMVDLEFECSTDANISYTPLPSWRLPKRLGIARQFLNKVVGARVTADGIPSCPASVGDRLFKIFTPSSQRLVHACFSAYHELNAQSHRNLECTIRPLGTSHQGLALQGLLSLFGGVNAAGSCFEDPFWRDVIQRMAGKEEDDLSRRTEKTLSVLQDGLRSAPAALDAANSDLRTLAEYLARRLTLRDASPKPLTVKKIGSIFQGLKGRCVEGHPDYPWWQQQKFDDWKMEELQSLADSQVFLQGAEIKCPHCGTKVWLGVDDLHATIRCTGCLSQFPIPVSPEWRFRLNDLVRNALQREGTVAILQALYILQRESHGVFAFLPCQDIAKNGQTDKFSDIDLVVISNGKFIIGEVKSSPEGYNPEDIKKLTTVALDLQPDSVIVAAPREQWSNELNRSIEEMRNNVATFDVEVRTLHLKWR